jgi:hypothetical protein
MAIAEGDPKRDMYIKTVKQHRKDLDDVLQRVRTSGPSREVSLVVTKLQEAIMWLGMELKRLGNPTPYPAGYDPTSARVEPTADGLKL